MHRDASEERLVHRLEAFSDVVIGFTLAQSGVQLAVPAAGEAFHLHPFSLFAFLVTFGTVCGMWWAHHKLFDRYFVPVPPCIVLNFASLAGVIFVVYSLQLWLQMGPRGSTAYAMYSGAFGFVCAMLAVQYAVGLRLRGASMDPTIVRDGQRALLRLTGLVIIFAASTGYIARWGIEGPLGISIPVLFIIWQRGLAIYWRRRDRLTMPQPATVGGVRK
jgi:uncharacterized membrane protein